MSMPDPARPPLKGCLAAKSLRLIKLGRVPARLHKNGEQLQRDVFLQRIGAVLMRRSTWLRQRHLN
jgi:hypothetical protein